MSVFIDAQDQSDLADFGGLVRAVGRWLNRDDLIASAPDFIRLAEARLRRLIVMPEMETTVTLTAAAAVPLPADFDSVRSLYLATVPRRDVTQVSPAEFRHRLFDTPGLPTIFAIESSQLLFSPAPEATAPAIMTYLATIPPLGGETQTNWLLAEHCDIYLYATLVQAEFYGWNDSRLPLIKSALDEAIGEVNLAGNRKRYSGAPLVMRPAVREATRGAYRR